VHMTALSPHARFEVAFSAAKGLKSGKNVVWWSPSLTLFEVEIFGKMPLQFGKNSGKMSSGGVPR